MMRRLLIFGLLAMPLAAQTRETVTVEVVDVPVYVRRGSEPVRGLTRDDFELLVNGRKQPIEYFDVLGEQSAVDSAVGGAVEPPAPLRERRLFLLVFDVAFTKPYYVARARKSALELVDRAPAADLFAVAVSSGTGITYTVPFTKDRAALRRALGQVTARASSDPLNLVPPSDAPDVAEALTPEGARDTELAAQRPAIDGQLAGLRDAAARLTQMPGQKHVIVLSEGFDARAFNDFHGMPKPAPDPFARPAPRDMRSKGFTERSADLLMHNKIEALYRIYRSSGVFLHTLDPYGLREIQEAQGAEALHLLASGTGGQVINDRNDLTAALADLTGSYSSGYLLGFRPVSPRRGDNAIVVRVRAKGVAVTHRRGFSGVAPAVDPKNGLFLADVVLNDVPQTGLAATVEVVEGHLRARVPASELPAELMVYLFDEHGTAVDFRRRMVAAADAETVVDLQLGLRPGTWVVKTLLRAGDSLGFTRTDFKVSAPRAADSGSPAAVPAPSPP
jgi:VWFA-related protein